MKSIYISLLSILIITTAKGQLTKGNWLVGGNANFSSASFSNNVAATYSQTNLQISPAAGYFFIDKLAVGLRPGYVYVKTTLPGDANAYGSNTFNIGPFIRYYFLQPVNRLNIFSELSYQHSILKIKDNPSSNINGYSISAGPIVYFNQSVGIEFSIGYSNTKYAGDANTKNSTILVGIGLQVHLEKSK